ncbi:MAG: hypothetical protein BV458_12545 [Thermoplasmata archaeon M9B2D]|nr:MAG: hypothetical protein BV458_12545 [Thermoplasmata archaeon M9B2D]
MANESTPEERLRKYKESLAKMALSEGKTLKLSNPIKSTQPQDKPKTGDFSTSPALRPAKENIRPPQVLVSPSKRELRESIVSSRKMSGDKLRTPLEDKAGRNRVMMKARVKAIDGSLQEIKNRKSVLELQFKKKMVSKDEYDKRLKMLVEEGQRLLREKAQIDKALAI